MGDKGKPMPIPRKRPPEPGNKGKPITKIRPPEPGDKGSIPKLPPDIIKRPPEPGDKGKAMPVLKRPPLINEPKRPPLVNVARPPLAESRGAGKGTGKDAQPAQLSQEDADRVFE